jgi:hypothetical protein
MKKIVYIPLFLYLHFMDALKICLFDSCEDKCVYLMQKLFFWTLLVFMFNLKFENFASSLKNMSINKPLYLVFVHLVTNSLSSNHLLLLCFIASKYNYN